MSAANTKYKYVELKTLKSHSKVDVFGVVKFFKPPYKTRGSDFCTMVSIMDKSYADPMEKLKCLLFGKDVKNLPPVKLGQIVRFHRLSITEFNGGLQGQNGPGFSWVLWSGEPGAPLEPLTASSTNYSITDADKVKVNELRQWAAGNDELREKLSRFHDVAVGCYLDLICQVVYTSVIEDRVTRLFKVWDGTNCIYPCRKVSSESQELNIQKDESLLKTAQGFIYEICVFDDHFVPSASIKPGDFVKFSNLHAAEYKAGNKDGGCSTIEFVLHRGNAFGRGVCIVESEGSELSELKQRLAVVALQNESFDFSDMNSQEQGTSSVSLPNPLNTVDPSAVQVQAKVSNMELPNPIPSTSEITHKPSCNTTGRPAPSTSRVPNDRAAIQNNEPVTRNSAYKSPKTSDSNLMPSRLHPYNNSAGEQTEKNINNLSRKSNVSSAVQDLRAVTRKPDKCLDSINAAQMSDSYGLSSLPRCMIQTSTVVLNHPHVDRSKIVQVLDHSVPYKFFVRAKVYDYHPKLNDVRTFLNLYCSTCHYLCSHPGVDSNDNNSMKLRIGSTFNGVPHFNCPRCFENKDSLEALDSPPHLKYTYMMRFILGDDTGTLMANVWMGDAVTFFQDLEPENLLNNENAFEQIKECLRKICPENTTEENKPLIECCIKSYCVSEGTGYQIFDTCVV